MAGSPFRRDPFAEPVLPAAFGTPRPLTAAATRITLNDKSEAEQFKKRSSSSTRLWQSEAWEYYDAIAEVKYAFNLVSNVVSRIRLYAATNDDPGQTPTPIRSSQKISPDLAEAAERALARLDSAYGGQAGLLRDAALNLSVAGECYLVQVPARPGQGLRETWDIRSVDELQVNNQDQYYIAPRHDLVGQAGKAGTIPLPDGAFVGRLWRAHPRFSEDPDSSMRGLLDLCSELLLLNRMFRGTERSRLNAGALYVPDGLSVAAAADPDLFGEVDDPEGTPEEIGDEFEENLIAAMTTPIEDEQSAASVVPLIIRGPAELGKEIQLIKFEREYDETFQKRGDRVLERILQGLDVPKDTVTGLANVKYSNAIQIDESLYKAHIEPMLLLIADAITVVFLRPALLSDNWDPTEVEKIVVWYDPSAVATRTDRAVDADSGYEKMAISLETWRRAHGFTEADAPTPTEVALRVVMEKGSISPELTESLLKVVAPDLLEGARVAAQAQSVAPVPGEVNDILNGGQGAPADPAAEPADAIPTPEADVPPGEDAPPFPLAEPQ